MSYYISLFHRLGRKKQKYTSKQTTRNRKETQNWNWRTFQGHRQSRTL